MGYVILPFPGNGYSSRQLIQIPFVRYLDLGSNLIYAPGMEVASGKSASGEGSLKKRGFLDDVTREECNSNDE